MLFSFGRIFGVVQEMVGDALYDELNKFVEDVDPAWLLRRVGITDSCIV